MTEPVARIRRTTVRPELAGLHDDPIWSKADVVPIASFHPRSSDHRPRASVRLLHDGARLFALFRVEDDRFVRAVHTAYDSDTYKDSCVELFVQPAGRTGYFALEVNCGGAFSLRYIEDPTRTSDRFAKWTRVDWEDARRIEVAASMQAPIDPELSGPVTWWVGLAWPVNVMEPYCGAIGDLGGQSWRGNAFKCADDTSHPHWASWAPIGEKLNFHAPVHFGTLLLERGQDRSQYR
ncbi:MAG: carbohydrate-binding family 9-like protein [Vicinamibacterales bacterium]